MMDGEAVANNKMIKVLIVEDESLVAMDMSDMLTRIGYEVLPSAYSYEDAVQLLEDQKPDIVLLDIDLGSEKTGLDLGQLIHSLYQLPFVFITSHSDKTIVGKAMTLHPNGYLVKPFGQEDLFTSIEVALANYTGVDTEEKKPSPIWQMSDNIFVKTDTRFVKLNISEIQYLESDGNYIYIFTDRCKHIVRSNFKDFLTKLPVEHFIQVHKSFIVQLHKIDSLSRTELEIGKATIPLGRNFKDVLFEKIKRIQ